MIDLLDEVIPRPLPLNEESPPAAAICPTIESEPEVSSPPLTSAGFLVMRPQGPSFCFLSTPMSSRRESSVRRRSIVE